MLPPNVGQYYLLHYIHCIELTVFTSDQFVKQEGKIQNSPKGTTSGMPGKVQIWGSDIYLGE